MVCVGRCCCCRRRRCHHRCRRRCCSCNGATAAPMSTGCGGKRSMAVTAALQGRKTLPFSSRRHSTATARNRPEEEEAKWERRSARWNTRGASEKSRRDGEGQHGARKTEEEHWGGRGWGEEGSMYSDTSHRTIVAPGKSGMRKSRRSRPSFSPRVT